jgi:hypothetical protein
MPIAGFNFEKIQAERSKDIKGKVNIKQDLTIKKVIEEKVPLSKSGEAIKFYFEFKINYEEKIGSIILTGNVLYFDEPKKIKEIISSWNKNKKVPPEITTPVLNTVLFKCNIKALELSQDVNLPPHIPLPKLQTKKA